MAVLGRWEGALMTSDETVLLVGVLRAIGGPIRTYPGALMEAHVDLTVLDLHGQLSPVQFWFRQHSVADVFHESLRRGDLVSIPAKRHSGDLSYDAVGLLTVVVKGPVTLAQSEDEADAPFSGLEQRALLSALNKARERLGASFAPTAQQMRDVESRFAELGAAVAYLGRVDWTKLFVECVVGMSVDLGFGTTVPQALLNLFKSVLIGIVTPSRQLGTGEQRAVAGRRTKPSR
jgi:hypothetical protein